MRGVLSALVLVVGCHASADAPAPEAPHPPFATCPATHLVDGPACVPRFDDCGEGEIAELGGGCAVVGVPVDGCAPGFTHDGNGGCRPTLPAESCKAGTMAVPGDETCAEVAPCGTETFGAIPDAPGTAFVDPAAAAGGIGSKSAPFASIAAALATSASTVALAAGTYTGDLVLDRSVTLVGRCPSKVTIVGVSEGESDAALTPSMAH